MKEHDEDLSRLIVSADLLSGSLRSQRPLLDTRERKAIC